MILVSVNKTWPQVLADQLLPAQSTLGVWGQIGEAQCRNHIGDVIFGIYDNLIVSAFVIDDYEWIPDPQGNRRKDRVQFIGHEDPAWSRYIGSPNPGRQWGDQGYARSAQVLPTSQLTNPGHPPDVDSDGNRHVVIDGYTVTVTNDGAYVLPPPGGRVVVLSSEPTRC